MYLGIFVFEKDLILPGGVFLFVQLIPHISLTIEEMEASEVDEHVSPCSSTTQSDTECESDDKKYHTSRNRCEHTKKSEQYEEYSYRKTHEGREFF